MMYAPPFYTGMMPFPAPPFPPQPVAQEPVEKKAEGKKTQAGEPAVWAQPSDHSLYSRQVLQFLNNTTLFAEQKGM
jgi:hypothetical protein